MEKYLILSAGGSGKRMGSEIPKQFLEIQGMPIIMHTILRFMEYDPDINVILVLPESERARWDSLCQKHKFAYFHTIVNGGDERFYSVKNGLKKIPLDSIVAIHDAVRPLVSVETIARCFSEAEKNGNAIPVVAPSESIRELDTSFGNRGVNRENIRLVQTPQIFKSDLLISAYDCAYSPHFTDDASVVERLGEQINLVEGNRENIKITTLKDLELAKALFKYVKPNIN